MTTTEITAAVAKMQQKRQPRPDVWQNPNKTWSHRHDGKREWSDKAGAETDFRFSQEWYRGRA